MPPMLPPRQNPDAEALARGQARLLADLSRLQSAAPLEPTEASGPAANPPSAAEPTQTPWLGTQAAYAASEPTTAEHRYQFAEVFARGGLGRVRRASDRKLGRTVAIKELLRFDEPALHRFAREAAITARLQHPGIIPLYDLGRDAEARPFLCMKLVEGGSLEHHITHSTDLAARLTLLPHLIAAAEAIAYAHRHHVIHRDLKPANILVGEFGETVVIDWGLAKDLSQGPDPETAPDAVPDTISDITTAGSLLGTLRYMPPEQARGEPVDARSDVYALGAVLHHLITGTPPFSAHQGQELLRQVLTVGPAPVTLSTPTAPRALAAIVTRATQRDPARRYASADAFADDLRRFEAGRLVGAHAYSLTEVGRLWLRRHRGVATVAATSLVLLTGLATLAFTRVGAERDRAESALQTAEAARADAEAQRTRAEQRADEAQRARTDADHHADRLRLQQARASLETDPAAAIHELAALTPNPDNDAPARLLALAAVAHGLPDRILTGPRSAIIDLHSLADGTTLAQEQSRKLWRWTANSTTGESFADDGKLITSPDGAHWARLTKTSIELHRADAPAQTIAIDLARAPVWYRWRLASDATTLVGSSDLSVPGLIVDLTRGTHELLPGPDAPPSIAAATNLTPAPGGRLIAGIDRDHLLVWNRDMATVTRVRLPAPVDNLGAIEIADDTRTIAVHCKDDRLLVWRDDGSTRALSARWVALTTDVLIRLAQTPEGATLAAEPIAGGPPLWSRTIPNAFPDSWTTPPLMVSAHGLGRVQLKGRFEVFDATTGAVRHIHASGTLDPLRLGRDQQVFVTTPGETVVHQLQRIDLAQSPWSSLAAPPPLSSFVRAAISANTRFAARQSGPDHTLARLDLTRGTSEPLPSGCGTWTTTPLALVVGDDGRVLMSDNGGHACLWRGDTTYPFTLPDPFTFTLALNPDGQGLAVALADGRMLVWDRPDAAPRHTDGMRLQYSPDGNAAVIVGATTNLVPCTGPILPLPHLGDAHYAGIAFSPTGDRLALYHREAAAVHIIDTHDGGTLQILPAPAPINGSPSGQGPRFAPSGRFLALADGDRLHRWDLEHADAPGHHGYIDRVPAIDYAFTADEQRLLVMDVKGDLRVVDPIAGIQATLRSETDRPPASRNSPGVSQLRVTPDGATLVTATGELLRWRDTLPPRGEPLRQWLRTTATSLASTTAALATPDP